MAYPPEIVLPPTFDAHAHLRQGDDLLAIASAFGRQFRGGVIMPNTRPAVATFKDVTRYRTEIITAIGAHSELWMTIQLIQAGTCESLPTTPETILDAGLRGARGAKLYPCARPGNGASVTHSLGGVWNLTLMDDIFAAMEEAEMVLHIHGEKPDQHFMVAETNYLWDIVALMNRFPRLRIVLEHVSSKSGVEFVLGYGECVTGTITAHHLALTWEDWGRVDGSILHPHHYCRPPAKTRDDLAAIRNVALQGHPKFCFGSDAAMHRSKNKVGDKPSPGVATNPMVLPLLVETFAKVDMLHRLPAFVSGNAQSIYGIDLSHRAEVVLRQDSWTVPESIPIGRTGDSYVPYGAGRTFLYRVI